MENFEFLNPVQIIFGKGKISSLKKLIPSNAKVLLTFGGGSIKRNGVFYALFQKIHNRIIKLSIFRKKNMQYESKDMKYYKYLNKL